MPAKWYDILGCACWKRWTSMLRLTSQVRHPRMVSTFYLNFFLFHFIYTSIVYDALLVFRFCTDSEHNTRTHTYIMCGTQSHLFVGVFFFKRQHIALWTSTHLTLRLMIMKWNETRQTSARDNNTNMNRKAKRIETSNESETTVNA